MKKQYIFQIILQLLIAFFILINYLHIAGVIIAVFAWVLLPSLLAIKTAEKYKISEPKSYVLIFLFAVLGPIWLLIPLLIIFLSNRNLREISILNGAAILVLFNFFAFFVLVIWSSLFPSTEIFNIIFPLILILSVVYVLCMGCLEFISKIIEKRYKTEFFKHNAVLINIVVYSLMTIGFAVSIIIVLNTIENEDNALNYMKYNRLHNTISVQTKCSLWEKQTMETHTIPYNHNKYCINNRKQVYY